MTNEFTRIESHFQNLRRHVSHASKFGCRCTHAFAPHCRKEAMKVGPTAAHDNRHALSEFELMNLLDALNVLIYIAIRRVKRGSPSEVDIGSLEVHDIV